MPLSFGRLLSFSTKVLETIQKKCTEILNLFAHLLLCGKVVPWGRVGVWHWAVICPKNTCRTNEKKLNSPFISRNKTVKVQQRYGFLSRVKFNWWEENKTKWEQNKISRISL